VLCDQLLTDKPIDGPAGQDFHETFELRDQRFDRGGRS
jgi:hypothetical protein